MLGRRLPDREAAIALLGDVCGETASGPLPPSMDPKL